jgi:VIT1/CCC1 family predicted Fe2+/Mn2+ transporter
MRSRRHREHHLISRIGWLRAAVLGANDGIVSVGCLIVGVAASAVGRSEIIIAGSAALIAGAMSMAAGEYVSVSSQSDTEKADIAREKAELAADPEGERRELAGIYVGRGVGPELAEQVAGDLMAHDALQAHARDELGISEISTARPLQAALASAGSFVIGGLPPLAVGVLIPRAFVVPGVTIASLLLLALLGGIGARAGGADVGTAIGRVTFWGAMAMLVTWGVGRLVGAAI